MGQSMKSSVIFSALFFSPLLSFAAYDMNVENNTAHTIYLKPYSSNLPNDSHTPFQVKTLAPFQRAKIGEVNYDQGIKAGRNYSYQIAIFSDAALTQPLMTLNTGLHGDIIGSHIYSSSVTNKNNQEYVLFNNAADNSKTYSQNIANIFSNSGKSSIHVTPVKYTIPNPHMNFQSVDGMYYVIQDQQATFQADDNDSNKLTVLTYNMQLWPAYGAIGGMIMNRPDV